MAACPGKQPETALATSGRGRGQSPSLPGWWVLIALLPGLRGLCELSSEAGVGLKLTPDTPGSSGIFWERGDEVRRCSPPSPQPRTPALTNQVAGSFSLLPGPGLDSAMDGFKAGWDLTARSLVSYEAGRWPRAQGPCRHTACGTLCPSQPSPHLCDPYSCLLLQLSPGGHHEF